MTFWKIVGAIVVAVLILVTLADIGSEITLNQGCNDISSPYFANPYVCQGRMNEKKMAKSIGDAFKPFLPKETAVEKVKEPTARDIELNKWRREMGIPEK